VAESPHANFREVSEYRMAGMGRVPPIIARAIVRITLVYGAWVYHLDLRRVSPIDSIARASTPILLIHGLDDVVTPPHNSVRLAKANARNELWLVPEAAHTEASLAAPEEFRQRVLAWFAIA
jgi:dipeptidyl aminopeptidase/acylaminoacyl peptidase